MGRLVTEMQRAKTAGQAFANGTPAQITDEAIMVCSPKMQAVILARSNPIEARCGQDAQICRLRNRATSHL
jgi:hypothetical protein